MPPLLRYLLQGRRLLLTSHSRADKGPPHFQISFPEYSPFSFQPAQSSPSCFTGMGLACFGLSFSQTSFIVKLIFTPLADIPVQVFYVISYLCWLLNYKYSTVHSLIQYFGQQTTFVADVSKRSHNVRHIPVCQNAKNSHAGINYAKRKIKKKV